MSTQSTPVMAAGWPSGRGSSVVVPLVITFLIVFFGKRSPLKGWGMATFGMAFVAVYGTALAWVNLQDGILYEGAIEIGQIGSFTLEWGWVVDGLSIMMYFLVGVVGFLVFVYANGYMKGDIRYTWFFASFSLFAGGMLVLVSAPEPHPVDRRAGSSSGCRRTF